MLMQDTLTIKKYSDMYRIFNQEEQHVASVEKKIGNRPRYRWSATIRPTADTPMYEVGFKTKKEAVAFIGRILNAVIKETR